jgi:multidrug efflux pump subunit AcrB
MMRERFAREFPDITVGFELGGVLTSAINNGLRAPINIQITGMNYRESFELAKKILPLIKAIPHAADVRIQEVFDAPEIGVDINRLSLDKHGISVNEVVKNIAAAVVGSTSFEPVIWIDPATGIDYDLGVRLKETDVDSLDKLVNLSLTGVNQKRAIRLADVSQVKISDLAVAELNRVNMQRVVNIYTNVQGQDIGSFYAQVKKKISTVEVPKQMQVLIQGEPAEMQRAGLAFGEGLLLIAILIYFVLVVQFRSFTLAVIIMGAVPFGIMGVVLGFVMTNTYLSIQAGIGIIFMIGIAVSNGVLMIEFIEKEYTGAELDRAIGLGAGARFRPILMTSLASVLGVAPMALGLFRGSEANIPLGRAVIFGQFFSVLTTLFVIPTVYRWVKVFFAPKPETHLEKTYV